jgi:uncharacterized repeat protein (TIGR03803 family)
MQPMRTVFLCFAVLACISISQQPAAASQLKIVYSFRGGNDGANPYTGLVPDSQGNLYGMTFSGGNSQNCFEGCGVVYELSPNGSKYEEHVIWTFSETDPNDGQYPQGPSLTVAADGSLYGTTYGGGKYGSGTIFTLKNVNGTWQETILYNFTGGNDGGQPFGNLVADKQGNLFGTASSGGAQVSGTVYELENLGGGSYKFHRIYTCCLGGGNAGSFTIPGPLVMDEEGNLYAEAGPNLPVNYGSIFELKNVNGKWKASTLYNFCSARGCIDGSSPYGGLTLHEGKLYGTTTAGGLNNAGVIFELAQENGKWKETVLDNFDGINGSGCFAGVTFDSKGNLYTDAGLGGAHGYGTVLQLSRSGSGYNETILYDFDGKDGAEPFANLLIYNNALWGTTVGGGKGNGLVFALTP